MSIFLFYWISASVNPFVVGDTYNNTGMAGVFFVPRSCEGVCVSYSFEYLNANFHCPFVVKMCLKRANVTARNYLYRLGNWN